MSNRHITVDEFGKGLRKVKEEIGKIGGANVDGAIAAHNTDPTAHAALVNAIMDKLEPVKLPYTLLASEWRENLYTLTVEGVTADSTQEFCPAVEITAEQLDALQSANIQSGGQSENTIVLKAFGDVPTIDIPILIILRG